MASEHDTAVRTELIDRTQRSWNELRAAVDGLDDAQLGAAGPDGWSVKDHLVHLERWEAYLLAELAGRDGRSELGLAEGTENPETDDINEALRASHAELPAGEVRRRLDDTHARVTALLQTLDAAELERRRAWIAGNTYGHFDEHRDWIRSLGAATTG
ncbi:MAG TPA: DinB family protein [Terriglobales bacterium]|nr:DinB family protein [Terriglobales bacterium]